MSEPRKSYNEEFRKQTVKYIQENCKTVADVAEELDIPAKTLHSWLGKYREFEKEPIAYADKIKELEQLLKEKERELREKDRQIADVEEELAIVKKAVHIFSKPRK